ncbi:MAG: T9SS type A sorting domain-containing protein [Candidatus Eisenbacteria bacterium]
MRFPCHASCEDGIKGYHAHAEGLGLSQAWIAVCVVGALILWMVASSVSDASAQQVDQQLWGVDPNVALTAATVLGGALYVGGSFHDVAPVVGGGAITDATTGALLTGSPRVAGAVLACISDGHRGWYIGGDFSGVGGLPRRNLAHIFGDGRVDAWAPNVDGEVRTLLLSGNTLYFGGYFTTVRGVPRNSVAAVDTQTGEVKAWDPDIPDFVQALAISRSTVYIGGFFSSVGGVPRRFLASVDKVEGRLSSWDPDVDNLVFSLQTRNDTLFAAGRFFNVGASVRTRLAAFDLQSGALLPWSVNIDRVPLYRFDCGPCIAAMILDGPHLYIAGGFNRVGGAARPGLAQIDVATASVTDWDPRVTMPPNAGAPASLTVLAHRDRTLYVAGVCDSIGGIRNVFASAVDKRTALGQPWSPNPNFFPFAMAASGDAVFVGGTFTSVGPTVHRQGLAAFDIRTGAVTPWNPEVDGQALTMTAREGLIYVGGAFRTIGGQARPGIAALDAVTGLATSWKPNCDGAVSAIAFVDTTAYLGGTFASIGGQPRTGLGEVSLSTGTPTAWDPHPDDQVTGLVVSGGVVRAAGWFTAIGGASRSFVGAVDRVTGLATSWDPQADQTVSCIVQVDTTVYLGGSFNHIGTAPRNAFAAVGASSGSALAITADADQEVKQIVVRNGVAYLGGSFRSIGGRPRFCLGAIDAATGRVLDWDPQPSGIVWNMTDGPDQLFPVGAFDRMGVSPVGLVAGLSLASTDSTPPPTASAPRMRFVGVTNPCRSDGVVHFTLASAATVDLDVYDTQGRHVQRLLEGSLQAAGEHELPVDTSDWRPGFYFYRLTGGSDTAVKKMVVLP